MNILDELTGGYYSNRQNQAITKINEVGNKYNVYIKFDNDKPLILFQNIDPKKEIYFKFDANNSAYLEVSDPESGKVFRMYAKMNNEDPEFNKDDYDQDGLSLDDEDEEYNEDEDEDI
jgi:hypothetical protein